MKAGFIGLGNVGGKPSGSLLCNGLDLTVRDRDPDVAVAFLGQGAAWGESPTAMMEACDAVITCLPSATISAQVLEAPGGLLQGITPGKIWMEMSTLDIRAPGFPPRMVDDEPEEPGQEVFPPGH